MKRMLLCLLTLTMAGSLLLTGCGAKKKYDPENSIALDSLVNGIPNIEDVNTDGQDKLYTVTAPTTDTYTFQSEDVTKITVYNSKGKQIGKGETSATVSLTEGENYQVNISSQQDTKFNVTVVASQEEPEALNSYMPYENIFKEQTIDTNTDPAVDPLVACPITYTKRDGGKYIYCNNPEKLAEKDIGQALLREQDMQGMYEFTFEHSNYTGTSIYLGYQLLNSGDTDAVVTVYNIGHQVEGEWLGQQSWSDFYNLRFELPDDYFVKGKENWPYKGVDFIEYTPRVFKPTTYRIPAGEYIYVFGGTSGDAYNNTNVANTADLPVLKGKCSNGAVKFNVTGGQITGTFYAYSKPEQVKANPPEQGYIVERDGIDYGAQYKGTDPQLGLIEANLMWTVNDLSPTGRLPVQYEVSYDRTSTQTKKPYQLYQNITRTINGTNWLGALNPQNANKAIGTDMMIFECVDTDGNKVVIDNNRADGTGKMANTGNWMVQYNDNYTLVNAGDKARTFKVYTKGSISGALLVAIRDKDGKVLDAQLKAQPNTYSDKLPAGQKASNYEKQGNSYWAIIDGVPYYDVANKRALVHTVTVEPHSYAQFTVDYLNMGNSCGGIDHWVVMQ